MNDPRPSLRRIDPQAEMERLAEARKNPPGRVWGVRHPLDKSVSVPAPLNHAPHGSKVTAQLALASLREHCAYCDAPGCDVDMAAHMLAYQDVSPWRDE